MHQRFSNRILFFALRELRSRAAAEDVRNDTLLRVIEAIRNGKLASPDSLPAFVIATARNVIREYRRKESRADPLGDREFTAPEPAPFVDPAVQRALESVLQRLKPRERDFLRLYYYEDLSKEEISERLGILPDRVRLIKSRALKSFREFYLRLSNPPRQE
ncbi:MAG: sigma-70 family RNA polymerase sigma factor [Bryobacteraceae bacterium]